VEHGFPTLPAGCHIELDRVVSQLVLANVRRSLRIPWRSLAEELRHFGDCSLADFLDETGLDVGDLYRTRRGGWAALRRFAGMDDRPPGPDDERLSGAIGRMLHLDDPERLAILRELLAEHSPPQLLRVQGRRRRLTTMLHFALWGANEPVSSLEASLRRLWNNAGRREELLSLADVLFDRIRRVTMPLDSAAHVPLHVHARYSRDEALAAFGVSNPGTVRQGVKWLEAERADLFFVTLRKTEAHYSPTTMYNDHPGTVSMGIAEHDD